MAIEHPLYMKDFVRNNQLQMEDGPLPGSDGAPLPPELLRNLSGMSGAPTLTRRLGVSLGS